MLIKPFSRNCQHVFGICYVLFLIFKLCSFYMIYFTDQYFFQWNPQSSVTLFLIDIYIVCSYCEKYHYYYFSYCNSRGIVFHISWLKFKLCADIVCYWDIFLPQLSREHRSIRRIVSNKLCLSPWFGCFQIDDIFLPPNNDLNHKFTYGYVTHRDQQGMYKLDLQTMKYVKHIDLKDPYKCVPTSVAFIPMGKLSFLAVHHWSTRYII